jgi:ADP-heptose:LPS heptosyltransferase
VRSAYLVLHPSASCPARTYPQAGFAKVGRELARRTGLRVVITGSAKERALSADLAGEIGSAAVPLAGETTFAELAAVVEGAALVVANNTSIMHVADALRTPSVILFAGTELESQWRPRSTRAVLLRRETWCTPCYRFECPYGQECLDVSPGEVVAAALELLGAPGQPPAHDRGHAGVLPPDRDWTRRS